MDKYSDLFSDAEKDVLLRELNRNILWRWEPMNPNDSRPGQSSNAPFYAAEKIRGLNELIQNLLRHDFKVHTRIEQLESALKFMIRNEEVNEALAKAAGEPYVNKGLDFARTLVVMGEK